MKDLTTGPIRGHLLRMSSMMLLSILVQQLYSLIDLYWVGRLGAKAVAAVTVSNNLMLATLAVSQILAVGTGSLVAQAAGRKEQAQVRQLFNQSLVLSLSLGTLFVTALFALRMTYSAALSGDPETTRLAGDFLLYFVPALGAQFPMMTVSSALRGVGDVRTASIAQIVSVILNLVLAPFLIFGWVTGHPLGIAGAGLSTLLSVGAGTFGLLAYVGWGKPHYDAEPKAWRPRPAIWTQVVKIGGPSGAEFLLMTLYMTFVMWVLRPFGAPTQAAFGIGQRWLQASMMPGMCLSFATAAIVGQNYGARRISRVRQTFKATMVACTLGGVVFFLLFRVLPDLLLRPFTQDPEVIEAGRELLHVLSWNVLAVGAMFACGGVFSGIGNTIPSLIASGSRIVCIMVPVWLLRPHPHFVPRWIWDFSVAGTVLQVLVNFIFLRREYRGRLALDHEGGGSGARPLEAAAAK